MSIQLPDGTSVSNWSPGWEKNLPKWYTDGHNSGLFNESNNWGADFFPQYRGGKRIPSVIAGGSDMVPGYHTSSSYAPEGPLGESVHKPGTDWGGNKIEMPWKTMEWNYERDGRPGGNITTLPYNPDMPSEVVPFLKNFIAQGRTEPILPNVNNSGREVKGFIRGIQDFDRNDLTRPFTGLRKTV